MARSFPFALVLLVIGSRSALLGKLGALRVSLLTSRITVKVTSVGAEVFISYALVNNGLNERYYAYVQIAEGVRSHLNSYL
jgi:hypothetical protein